MFCQGELPRRIATCHEIWSFFVIFVPTREPMQQSTNFVN